MLAQELITDEIPPLKTSDTGLKALHWMDELKVTHLPIVNNQEFLGLISDTDILDLNTPEEAIGNHKLSLIRPFVKADQHIYEVLRLVSSMKLSLIPVLSEEETYMGVITTNQLVQHFANMAALNDPGGIIVLELNVHDYTMTEIARIIESNDAKILSSYVSSHSDSTKLELTLKINRSDLTGILQTFFRFNYNVKASFHQSEFMDDIKTRFDSFLNYINM